VLEATDGFGSTSSLVPRVVKALARHPRRLGRGSQLRLINWIPQRRTGGLAIIG
jgi:hypothetical protein